MNTKLPISKKIMCRLIKLVTRSGANIWLIRVVGGLGKDDGYFSCGDDISYM